MTGENVGDGQPPKPLVPELPVLVVAVEVPPLLLVPSLLGVVLVLPRLEEMLEELPLPLVVELVPALELELPLSLFPVLPLDEPPLPPLEVPFLLLVPEVEPAAGSWPSS